MTQRDDLVRGLAEDFRAIPLDPADRAMLEYAEKLTLRPREMGEQDVAGLRQAGFDDGQILDIAQITAYFNFVNRIALGLGVELEGYWEES